MQSYLMHPYQAVVISQGQWTFVTTWYSAYLVVCTSVVFYDLITYFCHSFVCCIYTTKHSFINNRSSHVISWFGMLFERRWKEIQWEGEIGVWSSSSIFIFGKMYKVINQSCASWDRKKFFVLYTLRWRRIFNHFLFGWHFMLPKDMPFLVCTLIDFIFSSCMSDCSRRPITNN